MDKADILKDEIFRVIEKEVFFGIPLSRKEKKIVKRKQKELKREFDVGW